MFVMDGVVLTNLHSIDNRWLEHKIPFFEITDIILYDGIANEFQHFHVNIKLLYHFRQLNDFVLIGTVHHLILAMAYFGSSMAEGTMLLNENNFLHSMEKKSTKVDFSPILCKKAPFYTRNGHI